MSGAGWIRTTTGALRAGEGRLAAGVEPAGAAQGHPRRHTAERSRTAERRGHHGPGALDSVGRPLGHRPGHSRALDSVPGGRGPGAVPDRAPRLRAGGHGVPARRPVQHADQGAREDDRPLDLSGVRAELEALRAQPAPAERRRPCAGRSGRCRRPPHHPVDEPDPRGRQRDPRQLLPQPCAPERAPPGLGLLHQFPRQREPPQRPARGSLRALRPAHRDAAAERARLRRHDRTHPAPLRHEFHRPAPLEHREDQHPARLPRTPVVDRDPDDLPEHAAEKSRDAARAEANQ